MTSLGMSGHFMGMIGHFGVGPIWACVKLDNCCDPSYTGTLTHVKLLENIWCARLCHRLRVAYNSGLLLLFRGDA
jgi:hypothetical protein